MNGYDSETHNPPEHPERVGIVTNRGIRDYAGAFGMDKADLIKWVSDRERVLDIGAGGGVFEKEFALLNEAPKTNIVPFDIGYAFPGFLKYATHLAFTNTDITPTLEKLKEIDTRFARSAVGGTFNHLPFADSSFDGILAAFSLGICAVSYEQLIGAYKEVHRILKKGGTGFITVIPDKKPGHLHAVKWGKKASDAPNAIVYSLEDIAFLNPILNMTTLRINRGEPLKIYYLSICKD